MSSEQPRFGALEGPSATWRLSHAEAWQQRACPHCGAAQMILISAQTDGSGQPKLGETHWLRCPSCFKGAVVNDQILYPPSRPLRTPDGLPEIDRAIWEEARSCLGAGAYAAATMVCRKWFFHVAVAHGLPPKNDKGRAPSFWEAVEHLQREGLITPKMRPWVDRIKDVGNETNHELEPVTASAATDVATFTEQLLVLAYELDAKIAAAAGDEMSPAGAV